MKYAYAGAWLLLVVDLKVLLRLLLARGCGSCGNG